MRKRQIVYNILTFLIFLILFSSFASAGFFDLITGKATYSEQFGIKTGEVSIRYAYDKKYEISAIDVTKSYCIIKINDEQAQINRDQIHQFKDFKLKVIDTSWDDGVCGIETYGVKFQECIFENNVLIESKTLTCCPGLTAYSCEHYGWEPDERICLSPDSDHKCASRCGDGICQDNEDTNNCDQDCGSSPAPVPLATDQDCTFDTEFIDCLDVNITSEGITIKAHNSHDSFYIEKPDFWFVGEVGSEGLDCTAEADQHILVSKDEDFEINTRCDVIRHYVDQEVKLKLNMVVTEETGEKGVIQAILKGVVDQGDVVCRGDEGIIVNVSASDAPVCCPGLTAYSCEQHGWGSDERICLSPGSDHRCVPNCGDSICESIETPESCPDDCDDQSPASFEFKQTNGPEGGIVHDIAINQIDPNIIYALTNAEGLFKTEDGGALWSEINSDIFRGGQAVTLDPDNQNIIYVGTDAGIFKSSDAGNTWSKILEGLVAHNYFFDLEEEHGAMVRSIEVDPTDGNIIYAGTEDGKLYKSSDGGNTWELKNNGLDSRFVISSIRINYDDPNTVYVSTGYWDFNPGGAAPIPSLESEEQVSTYIGPGKGVFRSTDGGESWSAINEGLPTWTNEYTDESGLITVNGLAMDPQDPDILYLATHKRPELGPDPIAIGPSPLYKSTDGGESWSLLMFEEEDVDTVHSIAINPTDNNEIVINTGINSNFISNDAGNTWELITGSDLESNAFFLKLEYDPINTDNIYGASYYSSVLKSTDGGYNWYRSGNGITATAVYYVAVDPTNSDVAYAGTWEPTVFKTINGGVSWQATSLKFSFGYTYGIVIDPDNPNIVYAGAGNTQGTAGNQRVLFKSTDAGNTWDDINNGVAEEDRNIYFISMDPEDSSKLYAGTENGVFYKSTNSGNLWEEVNPTMTFTTINALVSDPLNSDVVYAGTNSKYVDGGGIYKTTDSGNDWQRLARYNSPRYTYAIAVDNNDPSILYSGDAKTPKLWKSLDSGESWEIKLDLSENEDFEGIRTIAVDEQNSNKVYAGIVGEKGFIYSSSNQGETWSKLDDDLTFSTIHAITNDPSDENIVYAAPWGGGFYKSSDGGDSWKEIDTPTISIPAIIVDPSNSAHLMIADRINPKIYESFNSGQSWSELVALDEEKYYRISTMALHNGELYFSAFNRITGMISIFIDGPMSGTTFKLESGTPVEISDGVEGDIILDLFSDDEDLYSVSHIYGVHRLEGSEWVDISPDVDMGFNNIISDEENNLYVSGASDIDLDLNFRIGDDNIINEIYKSSDRGETWTPLLENNPFSSEIKKLLQHPTDTNVFFAATQTGLYVSTDKGESWTAQSNGLNFKNIGSMTVTDSYVCVGTLGGGVYVGSINPDHSITWSETKGPYPEIYNIQIKADSNIIYATSYPGGVFKSTDGGNTWIESNFALPSFKIDDPFTQGYYSLEIDPDNAEILYLGIFGKGVYKSMDGAATWIPMYGSMGGNREIMQKGITQIKVDPTNSDNVYLAADGVYFSDDGAESWEEISDGLEFKDVSSLTISADGNKLFAGTRGASVWETSTHNIMWEQTSGPESEPRICWIKQDPTDPNIIYLAFNPGGMYKSSDGGNTWKEINIGLTDPVVYPIEINPSNTQEVYIGTGYQRDPGTKSSKDAGVYKSIDGGEHWFKSSKYLPEDITVNTINIDPNNHNTLYIGTDEKGVAYRSQDSGVTWQNINNNQMDRAIYAFAFSSDGNVAYVGTIPQSVWKADLSVEKCGNNICDAGETSQSCPQDCRERCICTMEYNPVCGVNGKTYGNACAAGCEEAKVECKGECPCSTAECSGCLSGGICIPYGMRTAGNYCNFEKRLDPLKSSGEQCNNNFECASNFCIDDGCVRKGLFKRFSEWATRLRV